MDPRFVTGLVFMQKNLWILIYANLSQPARLREGRNALTGGRASARRSARTPPTAPIPQDRLRHAFGPARAAGAADLERATEARTAQRQPSGTRRLHIFRYMYTPAWADWGYGYAPGRRLLEVGTTRRSTMPKRQIYFAPIDLVEDRTRTRVVGVGARKPVHLWPKALAPGFRPVCSA